MFGVVAVFESGCSSTVQRAGAVTAATALGAGAGYVVGDKKPAAVAIGGAVAAAGTALALGEDKKVYAKGVDDGYVLGNADATKRLYFAKQALETRGEAAGTRTTYYTFEGPTETSDGRKLAPTTVVVPIIEPADTPPSAPAAAPASKTSKTTN